MLLVRHAGTPGMRRACFPAREHADPASLIRAAALMLGTGPRTKAFAAPVPAAMATAEALGLVPTVTAELADADYGRWSGLPYGEVAAADPESFAAWLGDPHAAPHGGESRAAMSARVVRWLESTPRGQDVVAFCDAGPIRAVLGHVLGLTDGARALFDLVPLSVTKVTATRDGWRVAYVNRVAPTRRAS
ncbi:histidine phosphatase family protein [Nonomuraea cavernae]|uniref:histidine phosphatase family protein n=1 Tax=Nonomuraea cavernae TaxID=2045107 RepID=UPI00340D6E6E